MSEILFATGVRRGGVWRHDLDLSSILVKIPFCFERSSLGFGCIELLFLGRQSLLDLVAFSSSLLTPCIITLF